MTLMWAYDTDKPGNVRNGSAYLRVTSVTARPTYRYSGVAWPLAAATNTIHLSAAHYILEIRTTAHGLIE